MRGHTAPPSNCSSEAELPWTAIRNGMYADDIPGWFDPDGVAREAGADGRMSFSYRPELAKGDRGDTARARP